MTTKVKTAASNGAVQLTAQQMREAVARQDQAELQAFLREVEEFVSQRGYALFAIPKLEANGAHWGVTAYWGVKRL